MKTELEIQTGNWLLVVGPRAICSTLLMMTARLAEAGPVRVVDGGNHYNVYPVARAARGRLEVLERILVSRAFTCYQMLAMLESLSAETPTTRSQLTSVASQNETVFPAGMISPDGTACDPNGSLSPPRLVVLDLLGTFYDESVQTGERKRLLLACISHLNRLEKTSGILVSAHPAKVPSQTARELLEMLTAAAQDTYMVQMAAPAPEPMRLF